MPPRRGRPVWLPRWWPRRMTSPPSSQRRAHPAAAGPSGLAPTLVAKAYDSPASSHGAGQTIGIIELGGGYSAADLTTYFSGLGITAPTVSSVSVDGGANQPGVGGNSARGVIADIDGAGS